RATLDVDIFIEPTPENAERTRAALAAFGYDLCDVSVEDLLETKVLIRQYVLETDIHPFVKGTRVGPYEVVSWLGAGGMGEVYRARDPRPHREVAPKPLPEERARPPERLARLKQEARILASLNHPGIAILHGLEESNGGVPVLVMELVEGESLADRLRRGPL